MRIAYLVSRFPVATETFILRELEAVEGAAAEPIVSLGSLFAPSAPFSHPTAERWAGRHHRPDRAERAGAMAWALRTRPRALLAAVGALAADRRGSPRRLLRCLATVPSAVAHARRLEREGIERLHVHWATYPAIAAFLCGRLTGIPWSLTAHAHDIYLDRTGLERLLRDAQRVVTISDYNRALLRPLAGGTPVQVVRTGLVLERHVHRIRRPPTTGPVRTLCVASLTEYKGHRVLLDALATGGELGRLELELVGDGPLRARLEAQVRQLGLGERVRFHGSVSEPEVVARMAAADLFVLPSLLAASGDMEGLPVALLEALAAGVPAVGTALSGLPELLREEATCLLATPGDPVSLASAIAHILHDPGAAETRAAAGRGLVERDYDARRLGRDMAAILEARG